MKILETAIRDLVVVETTPIEDGRGSFVRLFCEQELKFVIARRRIVQVNHSLTASVGVVRGMHFQYPPHAEMKLVRCIKGRVWDVALDLRVNSPTFLKWHAEELTPFNARMMVIPEGFAHGFQVLEPESEMLYLHTAFYVSGSEGGLRFDDPRLGITWPIPVTESSRRDASHPMIDSNFHGLQL